MSCYLVTGCAGFIGSKTAEFLLADGHEVVGVDNLNEYYDVSLKHHRLDQLRSSKKFVFHKLDLEDAAGVQGLFKRNPFDAVVNLAARAGVRYSMENPHVYVTTNIMGSLNLLEAMRQHGIRKFVLASTSSLYAGQPMPFVETLPVNTPISPYAATKKGAEVMAYSYHQLHGIDCSVVRYFTVYGPAGRPDMSVFRFIKWIDQNHRLEVFGDGSQSRDFTYVDDIARGTIAAIKPVGYEIINLGGGNQPIALTTIIEKLEGLLGKQANVGNEPFHAADIQATWADISKASKLLDWRPTISIDEGLARTVEWYRANQPWSGSIKM